MLHKYIAVEIDIEYQPKTTVLLALLFCGIFVQKYTPPSKFISDLIDLPWMEAVNRCEREKKMRTVHLKLKIKNREEHRKKKNSSLWLLLWEHAACVAMETNSLSLYFSFSTENLFK